MKTMDTELITKIKSALNKCNMAVNGMMAPDTADEEKGAWIQIYNYNMTKLLNEYLADEPVPEAPAEDVGPITNGPAEEPVADDKCVLDAE